MTVRASCRLAALMSTMLAVWPPTRACDPGTACTAVRSRAIVACAAALSGGSASTAWIRAHRPSPDVSGGSTLATPWI
jgi:hypothetical protein